MKTIIFALLLAALAIWGGKTAFEATNSKDNNINVAIAPAADTQELMGMLPSGESETPADIAPAAGGQ
ncbi:MAG: hypothetical protein EBQ96_04500 [Proteobacteria bacterium]|nr:hypothetical protein [Pseudomonadota bacterium]